MRGDLLMAATLVTLIFGSQIARADSITTTTTETTTTAPAVLPIAPVVPDAVTRSYSYESSRPVATSSYSIEKTNDMSGPEHYKYRLNRMRDQISLGQQRGFLSQGEVDRLMNRYNQLASLESTVCANGFTKAESDDLEKQMNVFNVDISHSLSVSNTANGGLTQ